MYGVRIFGLTENRIGVLGSVREVAGNPWDSTFSGKVPIGGADRAIDLAEVWICRGQEAWRVERLGHKKRRIETGTGIGIRPVFLPAVENAVAGAQHQLIGDLVGQPHARRKIIQVRRDQARAASSHDGNICRQKRRQLGVLPSAAPRANRRQSRNVACSFPAALMVVNSS